MMPTREVWPLMVEAAALTNRKSGLLADHSKGEEDVDEARLPEGVVPMFYRAMLGPRLNRTQSPAMLRASLANIAAIELKSCHEVFERGHGLI